MSAATCSRQSSASPIAAAQAGSADNRDHAGDGHPVDGRGLSAHEARGRSQGLLRAPPSRQAPRALDGAQLLLPDAHDRPEQDGAAEHPARHVTSTGQDRLGVRSAEPACVVE